MYEHVRNRFSADSASEDADSFQTVIVCLLYPLGYVHINVSGDLAVSVAELAADSLDRDSRLRHEARVSVPERVYLHPVAEYLLSVISEKLGV